MRALMTCLATLVLSPAALADEDAEIAAARDHFRAGQERYAAGDYAAALKEFANYGSFAWEKGTYLGLDISHGVVAPIAKLDSVEIGYGLERNAGRYDIVGEKIDFAWTELVNGGVAYGESLRFGEDVDVFQSPGRFVRQDSPGLFVWSVGRNRGQFEVDRVPIVQDQELVNAVDDGVLD